MRVPSIFLRRYAKFKHSRHIGVLRHFVLLLGRDMPSWPRLLGRDDLTRFRRVLVLAPHPDDEMFGMGGTILRLKQLGAELRFLWLTNRDSQTRRAEAMAVLAQLGVTGTPEECFPLTGPHVYIGDSAAVIAEALVSQSPDLVCLPSLFDPHYDHLRVAVAFRDAIHRAAWSGSVLQYEVWNTLVPNAVVDVSDVIAEKERLMRLYESQTNEPERRYVERLLALNRYRGLVHEVGYAEGFILTEAELFSVFLDAAGEW